MRRQHTYCTSLFVVNRYAVAALSLYLVGTDLLLAAHLGPNILVLPEEVLRVVSGLDPREP